jgi:hypothetical protein
MVSRESGKESRYMIGMSSDRGVVVGEDLLLLVFFAFVFARTKEKWTLVICSDHAASQICSPSGYQKPLVMTLATRPAYCQVPTGSDRNKKE